MELQVTRRFEWERVLRRVTCLNPSQKLVATMLASYGNLDGSRVRPGTDRLINVTGLGRRTVLQALSLLRQLGLVERVFAASRAGTGQVDEYRLTLPSDLIDRVSMLDPNERKQVSESAPAQVSGSAPGPPVENPEPGARTDTWLEGDQVHSATGAGAYSYTNQVHCETPTRDQAHGTNNGTMDKASDGHPPEVEGATALAVDFPSSDQPSEQSYAAALAALQRLPDLGNELMLRAETELGDGTPMRNRVIRAAELAKEQPP